MSKAKIVARITKMFGKEEVSISKTEVHSDEANLAFSLIERWGMVAAQADGEDAAGRQKLRLMTPEELVERAFITAHLAFEESRARELALDLPIPSSTVEED